MIAYADFVNAFPEFGVPAFQAPQVTFWITQAYAQINAIRLGSQLDYAAMLFAAHNLILSARAAKAALAGAAIGDAAGAAQSKTVGPVSIAYDTASSAIDGAGPWNATSYGQRYYQLIRGASLGGAYAPGFPQDQRRGWNGWPYGYGNLRGF